MPNKDQIYIFSDDELSLIKNSFSENEVLLYTIRKVFLQFPLTDVERGLLKTSMTPELIRVLRKRILPEVSNEFPLGQLPTLMASMTNDLQTKSLEDLSLEFEKKQLQIDYLNQQFDALEGNVHEVINLKEMGTLEGKDDRKRAVELATYLFILGYVDTTLIMMRTIAGSKDEPIEKQKERMRRDSNK